MQVDIHSQTDKHADCNTLPTRGEAITVICFILEIIGKTEGTTNH